MYKIVSGTIVTSATKLNTLLHTISLAKFATRSAEELPPYVLFTNHQGSRSAWLVRDSIHALEQGLPQEMASQVSKLLETEVLAVGIDLAKRENRTDPAYKTLREKHGTEPTIPTMVFKKESPEEVICLTTADVLLALKNLITSKIPGIAAYQTIVDNVFNVSTAHPLFDICTKTHDATNWPVFVAKARDPQNNEAIVATWENFAKSVLDTGKEHFVPEVAQGSGMASFIAITVTGLERAIKDLQTSNPTLVTELENNEILSALREVATNIRLNTPHLLTSHQSNCTHDLI